MEAEAARATALLDAPGAQAAIDYDEQDAPAVDVPATWRLPDATAPAVAIRPAFMTSPAPQPTAEPAAAIETQPIEIPTQAAAPSEDLPDTKATPEDLEPFELPDPAELPALDPEMLERLEQVHARIRELQSELGVAMAEAEAILSKPARRTAQPEPRPELVDRRM